MSSGRTEVRFSGKPVAGSASTSETPERVVGLATSMVTSSPRAGRGSTRARRSVSVMRKKHSTTGPTVPPGAPRRQGLKGPRTSRPPRQSQGRSALAGSCCRHDVGTAGACCSSGWPSSGFRSSGLSRRNTRRQLHRRRSWRPERPRSQTRKQPDRRRRYGDGRVEGRTAQPSDRRGTGEKDEADREAIERVVRMILAGRHVQDHICEQEREHKLRNECGGDPTTGERQRLEGGGIYDDARDHGTQQPAYGEGRGHPNLSINS